jgi:hypothetical protein
MNYDHETRLLTLLGHAHGLYQPATNVRRK